MNFDTGREGVLVEESGEVAKADLSCHACRDLNLTPPLFDGATGPWLRGLAGESHSDTSVSDRKGSRPTNPAAGAEPLALPSEREREFSRVTGGLLQLHRRVEPRV